MKVLLSWLNDFGPFADPENAQEVARVADDLTSLGLAVEPLGRDPAHRDLRPGRRQVAARGGGLLLHGAGGARRRRQGRPRRPAGPLRPVRITAPPALGSYAQTR